MYLLALTMLLVFKLVNQSHVSEDVTLCDKHVLVIQFKFELQNWSVGNTCCL